MPFADCRLCIHCRCVMRVLQVWASGAMPGNASPNDIESNQPSWGVGANITTKLINQSGEVRTASVLADRTARNMIGYWHDNVVCLYVCPAVTLCFVTKRYTLLQVSEQANRKCHLMNTILQLSTPLLRPFALKFPTLAPKTLVTSGERINQKHT